jgi:hypothetical protein
MINAPQTYQRKTLIRFLATGLFALMISAPAISASVEISFQDSGTATRNAGVINITADGTPSSALNTSKNTSKGASRGNWTATLNTHDDIQNGAGKFNDGKKAVEKYAQAGYLFGLLDLSANLSDTSKTSNALINYVIWDIFGSSNIDTLNKKIRKDAYDLRQTATQYKNFDWSSVMIVYTENGGSREFFAPLPPIATPIPSALFLFGSVLLGLLGIATRKRISAA